MSGVSIDNIIIVIKLNPYTMVHGNEKKFEFIKN